MGSSKKHKEKEKRKRRHRSSSQSPSRDRGEIKRHHRRDEYQETDSPENFEKSSSGDKSRKTKHNNDNSLPEPGVGHGSDSSLSIEETNRLREKLGLKPLEVDGGSGKDDVAKSSQTDVHVPAENIRKVKKTQEIQQKLQLFKEKHKIDSKLNKIRTLGDPDSDDDSASKWVERSRQEEHERKMATKRSQLLEEMDQEFGIGNLVDEAFTDVKNEKKYSSKDLKGLKVQHDVSSFKEGKSVILTLEDKDVLEEEKEDVLINVNIAESERTAKNLENKKKKPDYVPWDEGQINEFGILQQKDILDKYNEEIDGVKKPDFRIGNMGNYNTQQEKKMEEIRTALKEKAQSLTLAPPVLAREFFTEEEMSTFKQVKKRVRKIRKKPKPLKASDLEPLEGEPDAISKNYDEDVIPGLNLPDTEMLAVPDTSGPTEDLERAIVEDVGPELKIALGRAQRLKHREKPGNEHKVYSSIRNQPEEMRDDEMTAQTSGGNILFNSTSEFCRTLGDIPTYGQAGNRTAEEEDELLEFERELGKSGVDQNGANEDEDMINAGWKQVAIDEEPVDIEEMEQNVLDDEPVIDGGIASTLSLATKKGYLEKEQKKKTAPGLMKHLEVENYSIDDKRNDDINDKYSRRERYTGGVTSEFKEKDGYKPDIKLEYVDDLGRQMSSKEAFRYLSHRFHGKASGKTKTEKRSKKIEQDQMMKSMSSTDTPLGTLNLLKSKQKSEKSPFIVLSGSGKSTSIGK